MDIVLMLGLILLAMAAGLLGSVLGLGGGIVVVPVLTVLYGMPMHEAVAVSLTAIAAVSSTSAAKLIGERVANVRIGSVLEIGAAAGAVAGAVVALYVQSFVLAICFAAVLIYSAVYMFTRPEHPAENCAQGTGNVFLYRDQRTGEDIPYTVRNIRTGMLGFFAAGISSALSGVGGGTIKIPIMNVHMHIPMKAASATSSYVIGITAFSGAAVYLLSGVLDIPTAAVVTTGAFLGSVIGLRILPKIDAGDLKRYFSSVLLFLAAVMILNAGGVI